MCTKGNNRILSSIENSSDDRPSLAKKGRIQTSLETENFDFLFDDDFPMWDDSTLMLDLTNWRRCLVCHVDRTSNSELILKVKAEDQPNSTCELRLAGPWYHTKVVNGDLLSVKAVYDEHTNSFKVGRTNGFVVTNPDVLISGTSVVGSIFCRRKGVLQERFRGIDGSNKIMIVGSLVHEIFQSVLSKSLRTAAQIQDACADVLDSRKTALMLYEAKIPHYVIKADVEEFLVPIYDFVRKYINGEQVTLSLDAFDGKIVEIDDIEENLWVPRLGLKGKIDVSVNVSQTAMKNILPLELKTGRSTFSVEHRGQVALYQIMLNAIGQETDSGLLLYLRDGLMRRMNCSRDDERDLIILRNEISYYITRYVDASKATKTNAIIELAELPEPIALSHACKRCSYATICCAFAKVEKKLELHPTHPYREILNTSLNHLSQNDIDYFIQWCGFLSLEEQEMKKTNLLKDIWKETPEARQKSGRAIIHLRLQEVTVAPESRYIHTLALEDGHDADCKASEITAGEYVIVSSSRRLAIAAGYVVEITKNTISVNLDRNLRKKYLDDSFVIDKHESQSEQIFNYTNLGILLELRPGMDKLREMIIGRKLPTCRIDENPNILPKSVLELFIHLNDQQQQAAFAALTTDTYVLIKGLPGTGKTETLVSIIRGLRELKQSVIITSHTHAAVDNIVLRLLHYNVPTLRLGSESRIHPQVRQCSEENLTRHCKTERDFTKVFESFDVIAVTCLGTNHGIFVNRKFDYCIVDEASQVFQPTVLRPLFYGSKFVLVGDPDQLPPLVKSREGQGLGANTSLFHRLDAPGATKALRFQYRMNQVINRFANKLTYGGALECKDSVIATKTISFEMAKDETKWKQRVLTHHLDQSVIFLDTDDCLNINQEFPKKLSDSVDPDYQKKCQISKYTNYYEAAIIFDLIGALLGNGFEADRIGVIAPFRLQVDLLKKIRALLNNKKAPLRYDGVEVNTVDQYQGRDKDVIFYSCTRTGRANYAQTESVKGIDILEDKRRLTVAITRAKYKLIIVGDSECLKQYTPFKDMLKVIPDMCKVCVEDGKNGFNLNTLLCKLALVMKNV